MQKITPMLWFDDQAEEAAKLYTSLFDDAKILNVSRYGEAGPGEAGSVMTVEFELEGQKFVGPERRAALPVHRGRLVRRQLRDAGGGRPASGTRSPTAARKGRAAG